jgi:hypothetical protein
MIGRDERATNIPAFDGQGAHVFDVVVEEFDPPLITLAAKKYDASQPHIGDAFGALENLGHGKQNS